ncbi:hypothetical protein BDC45DRAFT_536988 [Circinella umbellata]|nr:hypothetical protein BDC45DRAFT_536988 [Circinella umbellata]
MGPADAPKVQRRSNPLASTTLMTKRPSKTVKATMRSSTSSTEELSEPEPIVRYSPQKTKTRSSYTPSSKNGLSDTVTKATTTTTTKSPSLMVIGSKVSVPSMGVSGTLRFLGPTDFKPGIWGGIELGDSGIGKNDGCVQGIRYFTCPPQKGLFINESKIVVLETVDQPSSEGKLSTTMINNTTGLSPPTQRRSRQPIPEVTRSSIISSRRSKTLSSTSRKPSKASINRSADTGKSSRYSSSGAVGDKSSRYSVDRSTPVVDKSSRYSVDKSVVEQQQQQSPSVVIPETNNSNGSQKKSEQHTDTSSLLSTSPSSTPSPAGLSNNGTDQRATPTTDTTSNSSNGVSEKELYHLYELLEKEQREKDKLAAEITSKEAAWERLVSTKESYALRVKEKEDEINRLQQQISDLQEKMETAQQQLQEQQTKLDKNIKDDSSQEQSLRRIEKLEGIIEDMKTKANESMESYESQLRESKGQLDHLHHALKDQETMSAALERECEELRKAGLEAINAYETSIQELKKQCQTTEEEKTRQFDDLNKIISDLRGGDFSALEDYNSQHDRYADEWHDQRIRLEEQLELATDEVEQERIRNQTLVNENDKLRNEVQLFQMSSASSDDRFDTLRQELETELQDKRRLMEEADAAFEAQARAEDENYQMKMARVKMERELEEALQQVQLLKENGAAVSSAGGSTDNSNTNSQVVQLTVQLNEEQQARKILQQECDRLRDSQNGLEQECMRLMDELMVVEKSGNNNNPSSPMVAENNSSTTELQQRIKTLEDEVLQERLRYNDLEHTKRTEITQLSNELAELETLIENGVFEDNDLQEALDIERKRIKSLENELKILKETDKSVASPSQVSSPTVDTTTKATISTPTVTAAAAAVTENHDVYCELCEVHGHDVLDCTALSGFEEQHDKNQKQQVFCENCDLSGVHSTKDCPNKDEIF